MRMPIYARTMPMSLPRHRRIGRALKTGFLRRCPNCGKGRLFSRFITLVERCEHCAEALGQIRADDIPAYFTILIVGHVVVPLVMLAAQFDLPDWLSLATLLPLTVALTVGLLPSVKGAVAAHLWVLRMDSGSPE